MKFLIASLIKLFNSATQAVNKSTSQGPQDAAKKSSSNNDSGWYGKLRNLLGFNKVKSSYKFNQNQPFSIKKLFFGSTEFVKPTKSDKQSNTENVIENRNQSHTIKNNR